MNTTDMNAPNTPAKRSSSETGHAVNLDRFKLLVQVLKLLHNYQPPGGDLALEQLALRAEESLDAVTLAKIGYDNATGDRIGLFKTLRQIAGKAHQAFKASPASETAKAHAQTIMNKLRGAAPRPGRNAMADPASRAEHGNSNSQLSYEQRIEHFKKLRDLLETNQEYTPNEPELTLAGLDRLLVQLKEQHAWVGTSRARWQKARQQRNELFYKPGSGMVAVALRVRNYVASLYGNTSPEYEQVKKLNFRTINR